MNPQVPSTDDSASLRRSLLERPPRRIVVIARDHLGDLVNTTGALGSIIRRFPDAEVEVEAGERNIDVFRGFPGLARLRTRPLRQGLGGKAKYVRALAKDRFDLAVILDDSNEKVLLASLAGIPRIVGVRKTKHFTRFTASVPYDPNGHDMFDSLKGVLGLLGAEPDVAPKLYPSGADLETATRFLAGSRPIGIFVGASEERKRWATERFVEVADRLIGEGLDVVILAGPNEAALLEGFSPGIRRIYGLSGPLALAALIGGLRALVTVDSGPAHVAAAMGTPAVVIFGPTQPSRFAPYPGGQEIVHAGLSCDIYRDHCGVAPAPCDLRCMRSIGADEVASSVLRLVGTTR